MHTERINVGVECQSFIKSVKGKPGEASSSKYESFEYSSLVFEAANRSKVLLVTLYRKQEISSKTFIYELEKYVDSIFNNSDIFILTGDFNVWGETENTDNINIRYYAFLWSYSDCG